MISRHATRKKIEIQILEYTKCMIEQTFGQIRIYNNEPLYY